MYIRICGAAYFLSLSYFHSIASQDFQIMCAAEAVFCYTAENSHCLEAQVTSKNLQFQEEKTSERSKARSQVTLEKSSKNYIPLFGGKPARGLPTPHPTPPHRDLAHFTRGEPASTLRRCDFYSRDLLVGEGEGGRGDLRNGAIH